jgi:hypothetical protein
VNVALDEPDEYVDFMVKYKDWVSIRRLGIRSSTTPQEVVYHLAGIRTAMEGKMYPLLGIKTDVLDSFADNATRGLKKKDLPQIVAKIESAEARQAINASSNETLAPLARIYLLNKLITNAGLDTGIGQLAMSKVFPELKPPKLPPGVGRKKKAKIDEV